MLPQDPRRSPRNGIVSDRVRRVPLLSGSRVVVVPVDDEDVVIRPPPPAQVVDTAAAVRDALRFPLAGPSLESIAPRGGRATIVVEPWALPLPGAHPDPRQEALAAIMRALELCTVRNERQTVLVAGGLARKSGQRELERLLPPPQARAFRGNVLVHDAADDRLVPITGNSRIHPALLETELVVVLSAAETVLHGGPGALVAACDAATARGDEAADSLLEVGGAPGWDRALEIEEAVARVVPVLGVSLVLDLPRLTGAYKGYPDDAEVIARLGRSWARSVFSRLPTALRRDILGRVGRRIATTAAFAGPPSIAHAEALVRGVERRGAQLEHPLDTLVVGVPWVGPHVPREPVNAVTAAAVALGLALRLHRNGFPVLPDGTVVLCHPLRRAFAPRNPPPPARGFPPPPRPPPPRPGPLTGRTWAAFASALRLRLHRNGFPVLPDGTVVLCHPLRRAFAPEIHAPYARMFAALQGAHTAADLATAEQVAGRDERAVAAYRAGKACHPLLPYADWASCAPTLSRVGRVVVAGCRDAIAARTLGLIPSHSIPSALEMAHGVAGGRARLGVLLAPPYAPLLLPEL